MKMELLFNQSKNTTLNTLVIKEGYSPLLIVFIPTINSPVSSPRTQLELIDCALKLTYRNFITESKCCSKKKRKLWSTLSKLVQEWEKYWKLRMMLYRRSSPRRNLHPPASTNLRTAPLSSLTWPTRGPAASLETSCAIRVASSSRLQPLMPSYLPSQGSLPMVGMLNSFKPKTLKLRCPLTDRLASTNSTWLDTKKPVPISKLRRRCTSRERK
jgi:hypothetical protein